MTYRVYDPKQNRNRYYDKDGKEIEAGMQLRQINTGEIHRVFDCDNETERKNIGFSASDPSFKKRHPDWDEEYLPLYLFDLKYWEVAAV